MTKSGKQSDDASTNPCVSHAQTIGELIAERYSRRTVMRGLLGATVIFGFSGGLSACRTRPLGVISEIDVVEPVRGVDQTHHLAGNHQADILIRWGDPLFAHVGLFDPLRQSAEDQEARFGYNNDFIGLLPLATSDKGESRALLCVNHEYTVSDLMFPGGADSEISAEQCEIEKAAHGGSIVEIIRTDGRWRYIQGSPFNRRITARTPGIELTGPAAGHARLKTSADPEGRYVVGTLNNCAGGITPWGTYLLAEENFNFYFTGETKGSEAANHKRYGVPGKAGHWAKYDSRFDLSKEPNEPNRFGWIVEVDPADPKSTPKKRTALGRFKHEGAESVVSKSGRVVLYMGDDQSFDYLYKFVTAAAFDVRNPNANRDLLDDGVLYVARFDADGTLAWLPLVFGEGSLTPENGFRSQADILIETRRAADLLGATPMDRPEDVEPDPNSGRIFVMLTNNSKRKADATNAANPRGPNPYGHIIEITEPEGDFASERSSWDILIRCGDPAVADSGSSWGPGTSANGWFGSPDNGAVDAIGRLWVATDGDEVLNKCANGVWRVETKGPARGRSTLIFTAPTGAEVCGPRFSADQETLFLSVQHPGEDGQDYPGHARPSTFADPSTRWPDFNPDMPPRPSILAVSRTDGKKIGLS